MNRAWWRSPGRRGRKRPSGTRRLSRAANRASGAGARGSRTGAPPPTVAAATTLAPSEEPTAPYDAPVNEAAAPTVTEPQPVLDQTAPHNEVIAAAVPIDTEPPPAFEEAAPGVEPIAVTELAVSELPSYGEGDTGEEQITADAPAVPEPPPTRHDIAHDILIGERRHPLRFVWHMDADSRFVVGSDEFMELVGPRTIAACGRYWREIATEMNLDPDDQVARAIATQETWSGVQIFWPVDDSSDRLPVELSGSSGVRSRPCLWRLSRLRRVPRHCPHQSIGARAAGAADRLHADTARHGVQRPLRQRRKTLPRPRRPSQRCNRRHGSR